LKKKKKGEYVREGKTLSPLVWLEIRRKEEKAACLLFSPSRCKGKNCFKKKERIDIRAGRGSAHWRKRRRGEA